MTMSVQQQSDISELSTNERASDSSVTSLTTSKTTKRSFDVAFLISQDDKIKPKRKSSVPTLNYTIENSSEDLHQRQSSPEIKSYHQKYTSKSSLTIYHHDEPVSISPPLHHQRSPTLLQTEMTKYSSTLSTSRYITNSQSPPKQIFDDPRVVTTQHYAERNHSEQKSAFTKVKLDSGVSPNHSVSPDLNYQNSLSPSPPILNTYVQKTFQNLLPTSPTAGTNTGVFKNTIPSYPNAFIDQNFQAAAAAAQQANRENSPTIFQQSPSKIDQQILFKNQQNIDHLFTPKLRHTVLNYRPEISPYATYPAAAAAIHGAFHHHAAAPGTDLVKFPHAAQDIIKLQANPAAAILNSLLPPSLAALSLPAQNVCAKCNISFRMTSDLVYHMRSHHKNEMASDSFKKRREDKLKCPVCSESFRERHHLTRHMTAHQDKEGDMDDSHVGNGPTTPQTTSSRKVRNINSTTAANGFSNVFCK